VKKNNKDIYNIISEINAFGKDLILYPRGYPVQIILEKYIKASKFVELAGILKTVQGQASKTYRIDFRFNEAITVN
jgi:cell division protein